MSLTATSWFVGDHGSEETPDPIPNSEVKLGPPMILLSGKVGRCRRYGPCEVNLMRAFFIFVTSLLLQEPARPAARALAAIRMTLPASRRDSFPCCVLGVPRRNLGNKWWRHLNTRSPLLSPRSRLCAERRRLLFKRSRLWNAKPGHLFPRWLLLIKRCNLGTPRTELGNKCAAKAPQFCRGPARTVPEALPGICSLMLSDRRREQILRKSSAHAGRLRVGQGSEMARPQ